MKTNVAMIIYRVVLLRMRNVSDKSCTDNQNTYFMFSNFFNENPAVFWDNAGKCGTARQATDDNILIILRMLDK